MGKIIHIDMSGKYFENKNVGIAAVDSKDSRWHKGIFISGRTLKEIKSELFIDGEYAKLHAIIIYYLTKDFMNTFEEIYVCNDEPFHMVFDYLVVLFGEYDLVKSKFFSLGDLRERLQKNVTSRAHNKANSYRKRGGNFLKFNNGAKLNLILFNRKAIIDYWNKLN